MPQYTEVACMHDVMHLFYPDDHCYRLFRTFYFLFYIYPIEQDECVTKVNISSSLKNYLGNIQGKWINGF